MSRAAFMALIFTAIMLLWCVFFIGYDTGHRAAFMTIEPDNHAPCIGGMPMTEKWCPAAFVKVPA